MRGPASKLSDTPLNEMTLSRRSLLAIGGAAAISLSIAGVEAESGPDFVYGEVTGAVWLLVAAQAKSPSLQMDVWLAGHRSHARMLSGLLLCVSAAATSFVVGL